MTHTDPTPYTPDDELRDWLIEQFAQQSPRPAFATVKAQSDPPPRLTLTTDKENTMTKESPDA